MAELSKQEIFINDLSSIESQLTSLLNKFKDIAGRNDDLESEISELRKENAALTQKLVKYEGEIEKLKTESESGQLNSLNLKEREELKLKLQNLISRINFHLSTDRQV